MKEMLGIKFRRFNVKVSVKSLTSFIIVFE